MGTTAPNQLAELFARAKATFPGVLLDADAFSAYVRERAEPDSTRLPAYTDDLFLAAALAQGDPEALSYLERELLPATDVVLHRLGVVEHLCDEVKQRLRERLLVGDAPDICSYRGSGSLKAWLRVVAGREALGLVRTQKRGVDEWEDVLASTDDPHLRALKEKYRVHFRAAFELAVHSLSVRDRNVLRAVTLDALTVGELAKLYRVHRVTASRWVASVREQLLRRTRRELGEQLQLSSNEIDSVLRLIQSRLDVSFSRLLAQEQARESAA